MNPSGPATPHSTPAPLGSRIALCPSPVVWAKGDSADGCAETLPDCSDPVWIDPEPTTLPQWGTAEALRGGHAAEGPATPGGPVPYLYLIHEHKSLPEPEQPPEVEQNTHQAKLLRYAKAHHRAEQMASYLAGRGSADRIRGFELTRRADHLRQCGAWLLFRRYFESSIGIRLASAHFCHQDKLCPLCAIRRGGRFVRAYAEKVGVVRSSRPDLRPHLLTLTVKNGADLAERVKHLTASFGRLLHRRRNAAKGKTTCALLEVEGGVGSVEVIRGRDRDWHPHLHAVVLAPGTLGDERHRWPELSEQWREITGDSFIVDVRPIANPDSPAEDLCEVFKYALKFSELDLADNLHAFDVLRGSHLIRSFGVLRGVEVPDELADDLPADLPYMELLYRYAEGQYFRQETGHLTPGISE